ncbi:MAG: hypothetical protein COB53_11900 [Elusimicrobia bacterium]|nr:MAG: hypothetical protein COB53_11900 [Elusimicrobiota bacterium]
MELKSKYNSLVFGWMPLLLLIAAAGGTAYVKIFNPKGPTVVKKRVLSEFAKQVLLTFDELQIQPDAAAFIKEVDADNGLSQALANGLDIGSKRRFQKLVDKYKDNEAFRAAVVAAGGDPAACGSPSPDEKIPAEDCEKKSLNLLDP